MDQQYHIEHFDTKKHDYKNFNCGVEDLDKFLITRASQEIRKQITAVYILREHTKATVIGYYTLSSYSIELTNLPEILTKKLPRYSTLPTTLLGRLAIDSSQQGKGLGKYLLLDALTRSYVLSKQLGSFAVIVDAKDKQVKSYYEKYGFIAIQEKPLTLYLPMKTIEKFLLKNLRV
jgi:predicted GNAT family N-acyltransferase